MILTEIYAMLLTDSESMGGYGGSARSLEYYRALPAQVRVWLMPLGYHFHTAVDSDRTDRKLIRALVERWWIPQHLPLQIRGDDDHSLDLLRSRLRVGGSLSV